MCGLYPCSEEYTRIIESGRRLCQNMKYAAEKLETVTTNYRNEAFGRFIGREQ